MSKLILVGLPFAVRDDVDKSYSLNRVWSDCVALRAPEGYEVAYHILLDAEEPPERFWKLSRDVFDKKEREVIREQYSSVEEIGIEHIWRHTLTSRQRCVEQAREQDAEYLFFVDSDNPPIAESLERLVRWEAPIASGWYYRRGVRNPKLPVCFDMAKAPIHGVPAMRVLHARGGEYVDWCGMGCYLIHRGVLQTVNFEWNRWAKRFSEDCMYPLAAREAGFPRVLVDCDLWVPHINNDGTEV